MIFDLYKLHSSPLLDQGLTSILWDEHILKLGCGVSNDMKSAANSYAHMAAFRKVRGVVELRNLFLQHVQVAGLQVYASVVDLQAPHWCMVSSYVYQLSAMNMYVWPAAYACMPGEEYQSLRDGGNLPWQTTG